MQDFTTTKFTNEVDRTHAHTYTHINTAIHTLDHPINQCISSTQFIWFVAHRHAQITIPHYLYILIPSHCHEHHHVELCATRFNTVIYITQAETKFTKVTQNYSERNTNKQRHTMYIIALTHWGRVTHICVSKRTIIGSDTGLSPVRLQAIIWTNAGILLIGPLGTNFSEILIGVQTFSFKKMHLKMSSGQCRPFCPGLNVLTLKRLLGAF